MKRHVLVVTAAQHEAICYALRYVVDSAVPNEDCTDYIGDNSKREVDRSSRALAAVQGVPARDVAKDRAAILDIMHAANENSCSCTNLTAGHASDCFVQTHGRKIDRVLAVANLLGGKS